MQTPPAHALRLADEVGGEIVSDLEHARRAFAARAEAGRVEPVVLKDAERAELVARADAPVNVDPTISEATIHELQQLADELAMTRTHPLGHRGRHHRVAEPAACPQASAIAIHPSTIREAAAAVTEAEAELARFDAEVVDLGTRPGPAGPTMSPSCRKRPRRRSPTRPRRTPRSPTSAPSSTTGVRWRRQSAVVVALHGWRGLAAHDRRTRSLVPIAVFVIGLLVALVLVAGGATTSGVRARAR